MAGGSLRGDGSKAKLILIPAAAVALVVIGILVYLAIKANEDNRVSALRYKFNQFFPGTYNTVETIDGDGDYDGDGVINSVEASAKTSMISADTDKDGLTDSDEEKYGTNPASADTDGDGIPDGVEVRAGLDPLSLITDGKTKDADRTFTRVIRLDDGSITLTGKADIYGATVDKLELNSVSSNAGALTAPYELYCDGGFESAEINFGFDRDMTEASGIADRSIRFFKFDPYLKKYNSIGGVMSEDGNSVSCKLDGNGVYLLGADNIIHQAAEAYTSGKLNVHLIIDNSASMYPSSSEYRSEENDVDFRRVAFAQKLVTSLGNEVKFAISTFTYDLNSICKFDADKTRVLHAIDSIRKLSPGFDGTSVERAMIRGLEMFGPETISERNIIIILTDGISTETGGYTISDIVALSKTKNVTVMTISLGKNYDRELLESIAHSTGGEYFPIAEAKILEVLYSTMIASMDDDIVDENFDGSPDSYTIYDTGFDPDTNGFSFGNFKSGTSQTLDFGMVMLARDWFRKNVPEHAGDKSDSISYTFEGTTINLAEPLRKVILQTMQAKWMKPESYLDFLSGGDVLRANRSSKSEAEKNGWTTVEIPYIEPGTGWKEAELLVPDHTSGTLRTAYSENDYAMIRAIHYYDALRDTESGFGINSENDLNKVKAVMAVGDPVVTKLMWEEDGKCVSRYVLMTALRRDLENPNTFKIKIYDVNGGTADTVILNRTLKVTRGGKDDFTYTGTWNGKAVALSCYLTKVTAK